ncbi:MAG: hypothetical protein IMZ71_02020 [Chloroflexi bacterium]|nr:hypothetical protein [Chloroflexota bacterium]
MPKPTGTAKRKVTKGKMIRFIEDCWESLWDEIGCAAIDGCPYKLDFDCESCSSNIPAAIIRLIRKSKEGK